MRTDALHISVAMVSELDVLANWSSCHCRAPGFQCEPLGLPDSILGEVTK